ncbi:MAG: TonB-dependent receptor [Myxococcota bacterium]
MEAKNPDVTQRVFQQVSPRWGSWRARATIITAKFLVGRAFRAPSPTELAGANTFTLASNIEGLEARGDHDIARTDWRVVEPLSWAAQRLLTQFDNFIGYSPVLNLSTNLLSASTVGGETELFFQRGPIGGFANYSYALRIGEEALDEAVATADQVTWAPAHVANLGALYRRGRGTGSLQVHYQGDVARRDSDFAPGPGTSRAARGDSVPGWVGLDARVAYRPWTAVEVELSGQNLLDGVTGEHPALLKNFPHPFDYRADGMRVLAGVTFGR